MAKMIDLTFGPLGTYKVDEGYRIDGSKVRFWATRREAIDAAKAIGWPVNSVEKVHTRFQIGYAIVDTRFGAMSRETYGELFADRQNTR